MLSLQVTIFCKMLQRFIAGKVANSEEVNGVLKVLQTEMMTRFSKIENNILYAESTILDPRFKGRGFKNEYAYKSAIEQLKKS